MDSLADHTDRERIALRISYDIRNARSLGKHALNARSRVAMNWYLNQVFRGVLDPEISNDSFAHRHIDRRHWKSYYHLSSRESSPGSNTFFSLQDDEVVITSIHQAVYNLK